MTVLVAGIDFSTKAIDVALVPLDPGHGDLELPPFTLRREAIPDYNRTERAAHAAYLTSQMLADVAGTPVGHVWIEEPWTMSLKTARALFAIYGAIVAASWKPMGRRSVHPIRADSWRQTLGLKLRGRTLKDDSITAAHQLEPGLSVHTSEHACEALLIAHAGRHLTWRAAA